MVLFLTVTAQFLLISELSINVVIETAALVRAELNCPALAAGLFVNKAFIRGLLDQQGRASFLPLGDNWLTHTVGQDSTEGEARAQERNKELTHNAHPHNGCLTPWACYTL